MLLPLMWHEPDHIPVLPLEKKESKSHLPTKYNLETWFLHFWNQMIRAYDMSSMRQEKRILLGSLNRICFGSSDLEIEIYIHENVSQHFWNRILSAKNSSRWVGSIDKCAQKYEKN